MEPAGELEPEPDAGGLELEPPPVFEPVVELEPLPEPAFEPVRDELEGGELEGPELVGFPEAADFSAAAAAAAADAEAAAAAGDPASWWTGTPKVTPGGQLSPFEPFVAPVPEAAAVYAAEITAPEEEEIEWEGPPEVGPDGRGPWLDGPDAPWGQAPSGAGRRAVTAVIVGVVLGAVIAVLRVLFS
jgi:hypothetical protein